jgi:hypothetical protein
MNMKKLRFLVLLMLIMGVSNITGLAQCAMCRATLENNVSNGEVGIAAGINFGILYLFAAPYVVISVIAYLWFKYSKKVSHQNI